MISIYDENINFIGIIEDYESLIFTRRFYEYGEFELIINKNSQYTDKLQKFNIIVVDNNPRKAGIILHREIGLDEEGEPSENLFIKGYTLDGLTKFREIVPDTGQAFVSFEGNQESIMKGFVDNCIINPTGLDRKMNMVNAPNLNRGKQDRWRGRFENLADKLNEIALYSELGFEVSMDIKNKVFVFDVLKGTDKTVNQSKVAPVIFSMDFNNIASRQYVESVINSNNVIYAGGKGDYEDKSIQKVGNAKGIRRIEGYADFSSAEDAVELKTLGEQKLKELEEIETFEATVIPNNSFYYGKDYDLGDYVTCIDKDLNRQLDTQIIEIKEIRDENGSTIEVVFGNNIPTIIDQIKELKKQEKPLDLSKGQPGTPGADGEGLDFTWNGTQLGVKKENDTQYVYVNLVGPQGPEGPQGPPGKQGIQGLPGIDGKSIEFHWNGTQLGVRVEGQTKYQYVDLKGNKGDTGATGKSIEFNWNGTKLGVRQEGDIEYVYVDLKGDKGDKGPKGEPGKDGKSIEFQWSGTSLGIRLEGESEFRYVNLKGEKGDVGPQGPPGKDGSDAEVTKENVMNAIGYTPADKVEFDNLEIGGRNLLLDSGTRHETEGYRINRYETSKPLKPNTKYTIVVEGYVEEGQKIGIWTNGASTNVGYIPRKDGEHIYVHTFTTASSTSQANLSFYNYPSPSIPKLAYVNWACLYEGEVKSPLDWTPAPEDIQAEIDGVKGNIPTKVSQLTNDAGYLKSLPNHKHTKSEITDMPTKLSQFEMDIDIDKTLTDTGDDSNYKGVKYEIVVRNGKPYLKVVSS